MMPTKQIVTKEKKQSIEMELDEIYCAHWYEEWWVTDNGFVKTCHSEVLCCPNGYSGPVYYDHISWYNKNLKLRITQALQCQIHCHCFGQYFHLFLDYFDPLSLLRPVLLFLPWLLTFISSLIAFCRIGFIGTVCAPTSFCTRESSSLARAMARVATHLATTGCKF